MDFTGARDSEWQWHQLGHSLCMSASRSRQITMPVPHHSVFYRPDALPAAQPTASKHWRHSLYKLKRILIGLSSLYKLKPIKIRFAKQLQISFCKGWKNDEKQIVLTHNKMTMHRPIGDVPILFSLKLLGCYCIEDIYRDTTRICNNLQKWALT